MKKSTKTSVIFMTKQRKASNTCYRVGRQLAQSINCIYSIQRVWYKYIEPKGNVREINSNYKIAKFLQSRSKDPLLKRTLSIHSNHKSPKTSTVMYWNNSMNTNNIRRYNIYQVLTLPNIVVNVFCVSFLFILTTIS